MYCPKCGRQNPDKNKFCNGCGAALHVEIAAPPARIPPPPPPPGVSATESSTAAGPYLVADSSADTSSQESELVLDSTPIASSSESLLDPFRDDAAARRPEDMSKVFEEAESLLDDLFPTSEIDEREYEDWPDDAANDPPDPQDDPPPASTKAETAEGLEADTLGRAQEKTEHYDSTPTRPARESPPVVQTALNIDRMFSSPVAAPEKRARNIAPLAAALAILAVTVGGSLIYIFSKVETNEASNKVVRDQSTSTGQEATPVQSPAESSVLDAMILVPGGTFLMGSDSGHSYSRPAHTVTVGAFYIDATEVTNGQYSKFVAATQHPLPPEWKNGIYPDGKENFPVIGVDWGDAEAYASWAKKRLPTEEEWEFAARGAEGRIYPWGNAWESKLVNAAGASGGVREVGLGGTSPFGVFDMAGNAFEWTATPARAYPRGIEFPSAATDARIIRGGSWESSRDQVAGTYRAAWPDKFKPRVFGGMGIRCVADVRK